MFFRSIAVVEASASHAAFGRFCVGWNGRTKLEQFAREPLTLDAPDDEAWTEKMAAAFPALQRQIKRSGPVVLILPPHLLLTKTLKLPRVAAAKREKIVGFEAQQNIPFALDEVSWSSTVIGESPAGCDVLLAAAKLGEIEPLCQAAEAAGFFPHFLLPGPLAAMSAARLNPDNATPGTLLVNLGAKSTTLVLFEAGGVHLRSFPLGGSDVTRQVALARNCDLVRAENIKVTALERDLIEQASLGLAVRLAQETARTMLHFQRQGAVEPARRVLLAGGGAGLAQFHETLGQRLQLPVERLVFPGSIPLTGVGATAGCLSLEMSGAMALQRWPGPPTMNLLPARRMARGTARRRQPWLAAAAGLAVAALVPPVIHFQAVADMACRQSLELERNLARVRVAAIRRRASHARLDEVLRQTAILRDVTERRGAWLKFLAELQDKLVDIGDVWFDRMQILAPGRGSHASPLRIAVSGRMLDRDNPVPGGGNDVDRRVKSLLGSLGGLPFIARVEDEKFDSAQTGVLRFSFVLAVDEKHPF
jgi:type IV pilus assembly protein PilM